MKTDLTLHLSSIKALLKNALEEDTGNGDYTSLSSVPEELMGVAEVRFKQNGIAAGIEVAEIVAALVDPSIICTRHHQDGDQVSSGVSVLTLHGRVRGLLQAERLLLNCMQRMSGIATLTNSYVKAIAGTKCSILDTRKTTPNFRIFEKWAVRCGGGINHRFGLFDMILIKDNHVDAAGGIVTAVNRAKAYMEANGLSLPIEVETRNMQEVEQVLSCSGVHRVMLDNFTPDSLRAAIAIIGDRLETEASGGITLETVRTFAETGVRFISVGALTHSYHSLDISMKIKPS